MGRKFRWKKKNWKIWLGSSSKEINRSEKCLKLSFFLTFDHLSEAERSRFSHQHTSNHQQKFFARILWRRWSWEKYLLRRLTRHKWWKFLIFARWRVCPCENYKNNFSGFSKYYWSNLWFLSISDFRFDEDPLIKKISSHFYRC